MSQRIFRTASLDRLSSPEQLDQLMQVTDSGGWIALLALGALLVTAVVWGIAGSIPEDVQATGILLRSGGVYDVVPTSSGRVVDVSVAVGDLVTEGQVVARVDQPDLRQQIHQAQATLDNLTLQHDHIVQFGDRDEALQLEYAAQQRANLVQTSASLKQTIQWLTQKAASQERLVQEGLLVKPTVMNTRQQLDQARQQLGDATSQLTELKVHTLELENQRRADVRSSETKIADQRRTVEALAQQLKSQSRVVAPYTGRILEILADRGSMVGPGDPIISLDLTGLAVKDLEAVLYVSSAHGKQIRPGMLVQLAPSTVRQEEYGRMLARVTYVSDFPATTKGMFRALKNEKLVSGLAGQDSPYEVHADLVVDPSTVSGYAWSSSKGPPVKIQSGTLTGAEIAVDTKRPLEFVLPLLRRYTGI